MTKKDYDFIEKLHECDEIGQKFRFWNGLQFGISVGLIVTIGTTWPWVILGVCWIIASVFATIYLKRYSKYVDEFGEL